MDIRGRRRRLVGAGEEHLEEEVAFCRARRGRFLLRRSLMRRFTTASRWAFDLRNFAGKLGDGEVGGSLRRRGKATMKL